MKPLESEIERKLTQYVKSAGGMSLKFVSPGTVGVPDRILLLPLGKVIFVELKQKGKKLRAIQKHRKKQLEALGFTVLVIDDEETIKMLGL